MLSNHYFRSQDEIELALRKILPKNNHINIKRCVFFIKTDRMQNKARNICQF